jgi:2-oxoglutarate ferredoxin oxidoreductase subunit alpha
LDITFNIGGEAGQGIDTIGDLLTQVFVSSGFYTFTIKDFESRIRGGYNFSQIRMSDRPVHAPVNNLDVIVALSQDAITKQRPHLLEGGVVIYDDNIEFEAVEACHYPAPLQKTAKEVGGNVRMTNAAALGAVLSVLRYPFRLAEEALDAIFQRKGQKVVSANTKVAQTLYDYTTVQWVGTCKHDLSALKKGPSRDRLILTGNHALALGAMAANLKWISAYPMSPSTACFQEIVANSERLKIGTVQTEDEISAICMAIGASIAGARSMVTTSGGGFSLMVEALGLTAMIETPLVICNAQRPGPSTGLPTRTEQGDLLFMLTASQGEFPRIMLAPKDPIEAFAVATRAFNLSERFQVPVMILGDQHLADSVMNVPRIDASGVKIDRGEIVSDRGGGPYLRYKLTQDGISPRAFPGDRDVTVVASGNVHLDDGHITEEPDIRNKMVEKLMNKTPHILRALNPPTVLGGRGAETTLLTWGSTWGAAFEAMTLLSDRGVSINQIHFCDLYPLRTGTLREVFSEAKKVVAVEQNATSQFAKLVRMEAGLAVDGHINKYDGRPMTASFIVKHLKEAGVA